MAVRTAEAVWEGDCSRGRAMSSWEAGRSAGNIRFATRFGETPGTNPEELIGAAHSACFSMALAAGLAQAGKSPKRVKTTAKVHIEKVGAGFKITRIQLETRPRFPVWTRRHSKTSRRRRRPVVPSRRRCRRRRLS